MNIGTSASRRGRLARYPILLLTALIAAWIALPPTPSSAQRAVFTGNVSATGTDWRTHFVQVNVVGSLTVTLNWNTLANLNVNLYAPGGTRVASATSRTARPEVISYRATVTGSYKVGVKAVKGSASYELRVEYPDDPAPPDTVEIGEAEAAGIYEETRTWSANVADFTSDGHQDFLLVRHSQIARLYRNDGDGTFTEVNKGTFVKNDRHDCAWADVDQDGLLDAYCTLGASHGDGEGRNELWFQQSDGTFVDRATAYGVTDRFGRGRHTTFLDVNHDAYPDLFVGNYYPRTDGLLSPNRLFINLGGTSFAAAPGYGLDREVGAFCVDAADYNNDGWEDLLVCGRRALTLYRNDNGVSFTNVSGAMGVGGFWRSARLVDVSGDGLLDLVSIRPSGFQVRLRSGASFASPVVTRSLSAGRDVTAGDFDADGTEDLYLLQGATSSVSNHPDILLLNDGTGTSFTPAQIPQTSRGRGDAAEPIDYDGDGSMDFLVLNGEGPAFGPIQLIRGAAG